MILRDGKITRFLQAAGIVAVGFFAAVILWRHGFVPILVGLAFVAAGAYIIFTTRRVTIVLDQTTGKINILVQSLKGREQRELQIRQIQKVVLRKLIQTSYVSNSSSGRRSPKTYYQFLLIFVTDRNEELSFDFGKVSAGLTNLIVSPDDRKRKEGEQIATFIGVPLETAMPSAGDVFSALKDCVTGGLGSLAKPR